VILLSLNEELIELVRRRRKALRGYLGYQRKILIRNEGA
jgi:hypothetical protein